jgi:16S rRNA (cytosine967-C5)-methyltransferase
MNDRALVLKAITAFALKFAGSERLISAALERARSRAFVNELCCGTIRNIPLCDFVMREVAGVKEERTPPRAMAILRCALYEILLCPAQKEYAIVNEWVELAGGRKQRGFINGVLRAVLRAVANRESSASAGARVLPNPAGAGCEFTADILTSPSIDLVAYLSQAYSLPLWLVKGWINERGEEAAKGMCAGSNRKPAVYLRPNSLKTTPELLKIRLEEAGATVAQAGEMLVLEGAPVPMNKLPGFTEGFFCAQDITASEVGRFIAPEKDSVILDLCSAPGTKATHLAELLGGSGQVIATDINPKRLQLVEENKRRLGLDNLVVVHYDDAREYVRSLGRLDALLLDVPCSNTGVLARRLDVRYRLTPDSIAALTTLQFDIVARALEFFRQASTVFYSTCSAEKSENDHIVHNLEGIVSKLTASCSQTTLPSAVTYGHDGGYIAKLTR